MERWRFIRADMFTFFEKRWLLNLARSSICYYLKNRQLLRHAAGVLPPVFLENRGCFVTLTIEGTLKGCIGHIEPIQPLYLDVLENAVSAAFEDSRFYPLEEEELSGIKIEVSVLSLPEPLEYQNADELLTKLRPGEQGVILQKGYYGATFLPQVWEQLKNPEDFLSHLCVKAGLEPEEWKKGGLTVKTYEAEVFEETPGDVLAG